jgi:hypothetical protein
MYCRFRTESLRQENLNDVIDRAIAIDRHFKTSVDGLGVMKESG